MDRHHAGLFYSIQRLADRLGWEVFTPAGMEWWHEGYWRFGEVYGDTRLADQYLDTSVEAWSNWDQSIAGHIIDTDEHGIPTLEMRTTWVTEDRDYPGIRIDGVELTEAREMTWDYVMPTVQENQRGFHRFAVEHDATYLYQVGNTGQQVDWSLDPIALVSSEVPILGRGVRYHQEMHPAYDWRPPTERKVIRSFVNLFPKIECFPLAMEVWSKTPDFRWYLNGALCPDDFMYPTTAVADAMAGSGWGYHDKVTGDGFGHVLWGWAAIGRPLIGHASHYAGKLGGVLWRDLVTCIDLDQHSTEEAAVLIRAISEDEERHRAMCSAMRATFEAHYDPERDAQAIARLLGV